MQMKSNFTQQQVSNYKVVAVLPAHQHKTFLLALFSLPLLLPAGRTAQLVAKYRPPMPILTLVVPRLVNDGIRWRLEGK
jgi:hypothetical protein